MGLLLAKRRLVEVEIGRLDRERVFPPPAGVPAVAGMEGSEGRLVVVLFLVLELAHISCQADSSAPAPP